MRVDTVVPLSSKVVASCKKQLFSREDEGGWWASTEGQALFKGFQKAALEETAREKAETIQLFPQQSKLGSKWSARAAAEGFCYYHY